MMIKFSPNVVSVCLQESQAISLVSVANVLGEVQPHRGIRRQASHSEDQGSEKGASLSPAPHDHHHHYVYVTHNLQTRLVSKKKSPPCRFKTS